VNFLSENLDPRALYISKQEHNGSVTGADLKVLPDEQHKAVSVYLK